MNTGVFLRITVSAVIEHFVWFSSLSDFLIDCLFGYLKWFEEILCKLVIIFNGIKLHLINVFVSWYEFSKGAEIYYALFIFNRS